MKKKLILATALLLVGCEFPEKHFLEGKVTAKDYIPSYTTFMPMFTGKATVMLPIVHNEQWLVTCADDKHSQQVSVSKEDYDKVYVGGQCSCVAYY